MQSPTHRSASSAPLASKDAEPFHRTRRWLIFWSIALGGCTADLLSKEWVFFWRGLPRPGNEWWIWEPYVGIETAMNTGAVFGLGAGWGFWFAVLSIVAAVAILIWLFYLDGLADRLLTVALACVTAGIFGNLYDRMGLWSDGTIPPVWRHAVRDWILFRYPPYTWPNFNIADSLLVCGAALLMWQAFRQPAPAEKAETAGIN